MDRIARLWWGQLGFASAALALSLMLGASLLQAPDTQGAPLAAPIVYSATGANPAAIQATVDGFRSTLGPNNGVGGAFTSGRREINWDGVPDGFAAPNNF